MIRRPPIDPVRLLLGCGIIAPLADVALIAFFASLHPDYDHIRHLMSELGEAGRPFSHFVNAWFSVAGVLLVAFGIGLAIALPRNHLARIGAALYVAWAALAVVSGFFPCDSGCRGETASGWIHLTLGEVAAACIVPVPALVWAAVCRDARWRGLGWFTLAIQVLAVCLTIASAAAAYEAYVVDQSLRDFAGLFQRLGWGVNYIWTVVMAIILLRSGK